MAPSQAAEPGPETDSQAGRQVVRLANGDLRITLPERADLTASASSSLAGAPYTTPSTDERNFVQAGYTCETGRTCLEVPYGGGWYVFKEDSYGTYAMYDWYGEGTWVDNQTGNWSTSIQDGSTQVQCLQSGYDDSVNWTPIDSFWIRSWGC
ncbi:hypothetical protein [Myceligenerans crystallogenes]|uniref:hypothetical protein n=1 Tax=Myceligenerans crystallogenes TaxID=316335 RepID=UPI0031DB4054